jgi:hypothetical protein
MSLNYNKLENPITVVQQGSTPSAPASGNQIVYAKSDGKIYTQTSSSGETVVGGGLEIVNLTITTGSITTPLAIGKHYVIDMTGANGNKSTTLPAAASGSNIRVTVLAHTSYKVTLIAATSPDQDYIYYDGTQYTDLDIPAASKSGQALWMELCGKDATDWVVEDATTPLSGTFSGSLTVTGDFSFQGYSHIALTTANGFGSTNTKIRKYTNSSVTGSAMSYTSNSTNGDSITINTSGLYSIYVMDGRNDNTETWGLSKNSNELTTSLVSITETHKLAVNTISAASTTTDLSWTGPLTAGDVIRAHSAGALNATTTARLLITKIG